MKDSAALNRVQEGQVGWIVTSKPEPFWRCFVWPNEWEIVEEYKRHPEMFHIVEVYKK